MAKQVDSTTKILEMGKKASNEGVFPESAIKNSYSNSVAKALPKQDALESKASSASVISCKQSLAEDNVDNNNNQLGISASSTSKKQKEAEEMLELLKGTTASHTIV